METQIFLRTLLPLLEVVVAERPIWRERISRTTADIDIRIAGSPLGTRLHLERGSLAVTDDLTGEGDLTLWFRSHRALNRFFVGRPSLPRIRGAVRRPRLLWHLVGLLGQLRLLAPRTTLTRPADQALYVRLALYFITGALVEMNRAGHPEMTALTENSPERVYQWWVADQDIGAYLRMHQGQAWAGVGVYPHRRPFVKYTFPTAASAYRVLTTSGSQMDSVIRGDVRPEGSPEYSRKISILMQRAEALMTGH